MAIAVISDLHRQVPEPESDSCFPGQLRRLPEDQAAALYENMRVATEHSFEALLADLRRREPVAILCLGDTVSGWQERGIAHRSTQCLARDTALRLGNIAPVHFCLGNHETGYRSPVSVLGDIGFESVMACRNIFGPSSWSFDAGDVRLIGVASPLITYDGSDHGLRVERELQAERVATELGAHAGPWVLCLHEVFAVRYLHPQLAPHLKRLAGVLYGDVHNPRMHAPLHWLSGLPGLPLLGSKSWATLVHCLRRGTVCPSVAPFWWRGYEYLTLSLEGGVVRTTRVQLPRPADADNIPVSSFWRALWWMVKARF